MDRRAIGVFDSGMGGLTTVRELERRFPYEDIIYFGDTGRVPYGSRSPETILRYARQDVAFLRTFDLKAIVIACGTVSSIALDQLEQECPVPMIGVVEPAARAAAKTTRNGRVGLIGTKGTISSGAYVRALKELHPDVEVTAQACPLFVPLVENGRFRKGDPLVELVVKEYLEPFQAAGVDTMILGCTHYPLLTEAIGAYMGPEVTLISSGAACVETVARVLVDNGLESDKQEVGVRRYFASDSPESFEELASIFLGEDIHHQAVQIAIETY